MKYFERNHDYKYELAEPYFLESGFLVKELNCCCRFVSIKDHKLSIDKGYAWDGSSIPFKKWLPWDSDKYCKKASLVHDAFYQLMRLNLLDRKHKDAIDRMYESLCMWGGMPPRQAARRYWAVKHFGARTLKPRYYPEKQILET